MCLFLGIIRYILVYKKKNQKSHTTENTTPKHESYSGFFTLMNVAQKAIMEIILHQKKVDL